MRPNGDQCFDIRLCNVQMYVLVYIIYININIVIIKTILEVITLYLHAYRKSKKNVYRMVVNRNSHLGHCACREYQCSIVLVAAPLESRLAKSEFSRPLPSNYKRAARWDYL